MRTAFLLLSATLVFAACRGKESMASRSAKAYDKAIRAGSPIGGDDHGGHAANAGQSATATMDHATMTGMDQSTMTGMDHSKMAGMDQSKTAGMDHSKMAGLQPGQQEMAGMQHGQTPQGQQGMAGMQQMPMQQPPTPMDHAAMGHAPAPSPTSAAQRTFPISEAPARSGEMAQLRPSSTLSADPQDAPASSAVSEASKAAAAASGAHAGHAQPPGSGSRR